MNPQPMDYQQLGVPLCKSNWIVRQLLSLLYESKQGAADHKKIFLARSVYVAYSLK